MLRQAQRVSANEVRQVCIELERRLGAGEACDAESVFAAHPQLRNDADAALEVIYTEFVAREQRGERPAPADFCARFPQWREGLEQLFEIHGTVGARSTVARSGGADTPRPDGRGLDSRLEPAQAGTGGSGPRRIGNYEVLGEIGRGGMGVVYKARQLGLNRLVALKMILAGADAGPRELSRFRAEAEAAARLHHPNIVQIHEVGEHDGRPFLSLEYVAGGSLEEQLSGTPWPAADAARLIETLARAMQHAHERGVVHRDLKPANVLLSPNPKSESRNPRQIRNEEASNPQPIHGGAPDLKHDLKHSDSELVSDFELRISDLGPKITDFGLARRLPVGDTAAEAPTAQTRSGAILGTPAYMAPEQAAGDGRKIGPAADIYALGAMLYELLTARPPFQGVSVLATLQQIRVREPLPPSRLLPGLPRDLETICLECLHKEPGRRYPSAVALADDLGRFLRGEPIQARPTPAWEKAWKWTKRRPAVAALLAALVVLTVVGLTSVTLLWRQAAAALVIVQQKHEETEAALAAKLVVLAHRDWLANDLEQARRHLDQCSPALRGPEWRYLDRVCNACLFVLQDSASKDTKLWTVAWSPDGRHIATNHAQHAARIWDAATGNFLFDLPGQGQGYAKLAFDPDGRLVSLRVPPLAPNTVEAKIWDLATRTEVRVYKTPVFLGKPALSGDARRLAVTGDKHFTIVDVGSGAVLRTTPIKVYLNVVALSADGRLMAWGYNQPAIGIWNLAAAAATGPLIRQKAEFLVFSPDDKRLATCQFDRDSLVGDCRIWDLGSGKAVHVLRGHTGFVYCAAYSRDGRRIATAGQDGTVIVWDADAGQELFTFRGHRAPVVALEFSPDGLRLASVAHDAARIWDVRPFDGPAPESLARTSFLPSSQPTIPGDDKRTVRGVEQRDVGQRDVGQRDVADSAKKGIEVGKDGLKLKGKLTTQIKNFAYAVKMEEGKTYQIRLTSRQFDAYLFVKDNKGKQLDYDDDSGGGTDSLLEFRAPASGVFRVIATSLGMDGAGDYELLIVRQP